MEPDEPAPPEVGLEPRPPSGLAPDDLLADRYRVIRKLGAGGMGEVWEAHHIVLDKRVAIKALVLDGRRDDGTRAERLMREAKFVGRIDHPNVVEITDFGHTASGLPYFVMELLRGRPLHEILRDHGPLPWQRVVEIGSGIAQGLAAAHAIGVIHRDLKPANAFVLDDPARAGVCKVIDFGIAKATAVDDRDRALTRTGFVFGTPAYMSPEQARGETLDGRSDIYGLGCILHESLTGRRLFGAKNPAEILYRQLFESPPAPSTVVPEADIPTAIDAIVLRCLLKEPANRFQQMQDVVDALVAAKRGEPIALPAAETLPLPPAALQARYGSPRAESYTRAPGGSPAAGATVPAVVASMPTLVEPATARSRSVLTAVAWIGGGAALGLALVVGGALGHRAWSRRDANVDATRDAAADAIDDGAPKRLEVWIDDLPRQLELADPPMVEPEIVVPPPTTVESSISRPRPAPATSPSRRRPKVPQAAPAPSAKQERKSGDDRYSIFEDG